MEWSTFERISRRPVAHFLEWLFGFAVSDKSSVHHPFGILFLANCITVLKIGTDICLFFIKKRGFQGKGTRNFSIFLNTLGFVDDLYRLQDVIESKI